MPTNRTGSKALTRAERDAEVLRLRRADYTYAEITERTGMDGSNARRLVEKHLADLPAADAAELRQWERTKLNELERSAWPQAYDFFAELDASGKPVMEPVCDADGLVMLDQDGLPMMRIRRDWNIANQGRALLLKTHEARSKMFGLAAPVRTSTAFENGFEEDRNVTFRIVDAGAGHPLLQNCSPEELLILIRFAEEQGFGKGPQPKQLGTLI